MKKRAVSAFLCAAFALGALAGCTHDVEQEVEKEVEKDVNVSAYSQVWRVTDLSVKHEDGVGGLTADSAWGAIPKANKAGVLCEVETQTLYKTAYTAAARLLVNEENNPSSKDVACVLRVVDGDGVELGRRNVRMAEFEEKLTYQDFTFTFPVETQGKAKLQVYWPGSNYLRVSEFGIMSKKNDALNGIDFNEPGKRLLGVDIEESVEYEESALYYFDLFDYMETVAIDAEEQYDIANLVSTLQGLVNRNDQKLFINFRNPNKTFPDDTDKYWLKELAEDDGSWLKEKGKEVVTVKSPMTLLKLFKDYYVGFAAWDPAVPATVNAVATACGVDDLLPVRYSSVRNSLYSYLKTTDGFKPFKLDLGRKFTGEGTIYGTETPSTGSRKNDAYIWAKETYLDTHKTNSHMMAYHVDAYGSNTVFAAYGDLQNMYLSNRDYYIANKAFFFDLSLMRFEIPDDDPDQKSAVVGVNGTTDIQTFDKIMKSQAAWAEESDATKPIDVGGFTPWHLKYTKYTNPLASEEVKCEWATVYEFSTYNASVNADAPHYTAMANASIYMNYPMQESYTQKGKAAQDGYVFETLPTGSERGANYLMFYMGDFDASAWLNTAMPTMWNDEARGKFPLCWTFSLDITKRAGHVVDMMYKTATDNDYFVAGDNGTGYLNPIAFVSKNRPEGVYGDLDSWAEYNKKAYERFDIDYTGFLIGRNENDLTKEILECYAKFCKGVALNWEKSVTNEVEGLSVTLSNDYSDMDMFKVFPEKTAGSSSTFRQIRFILRTPSDVYKIYKALTEDPAYAKQNFKIVDPYTFYTLLAQQGNMG